MKPLFIIPARMGSTRIPDKNVRLLYGKSPLRRAIACCRDIPGGIILVTANWGKEEFADGVYWHRVDAPLHTDTCSMVDVVLDVLNKFPGDEEQPVLLVQPTQPLRRPEHLRHALTLLESHPSIASLVEVETAHKLYFYIDTHLYPVLEDPVERTQLGQQTFACDGTVYGFHRKWFLQHCSFRHTDTMPFVVPPDETCRLDTPQDWLIAGLLLEHRGKG